jgi:hypothetical protein
MHRLPAMTCFTLLLALWSELGARGETVVFNTESSATQMIYSPLLGGTVMLDAYGPQQFTVDTATGFANVTSDFKGSDFPDPLNPGHTLTYDLYNTVTTGTVTTTPSGAYDISYQLLFELKITSGVMAGFTFETLQYATFAASNIPTLPFPVGTAFSDPNGPGNDAVNIYVKYDPTNTYAPGTLAGVSFDRVVTVDAIVPEPSTLTLAMFAVVPAIGFWRWRRRSSNSV